MTVNHGSKQFLLTTLQNLSGLWIDSYSNDLKWKFEKKICGTLTNNVTKKLLRFLKSVKFCLNFDFFKKILAQKINLAFKLSCRFNDFLCENLEARYSQSKT